MQRSVSSCEEMPPATRSNSAGWPGIGARAVVMMAALWGSVGCESDSFVPPVNPELEGAVDAPVGVSVPSAAPTLSAGTPEPARPIEVILGQHGPDEAEVWKASARTQAGLDKTRLKISVLDELSPKSKQAELIREALVHRPRAFVVEPSNPADPRLVEAVDAVQDQGIPVVLVGRPLAATKPAAETPDAKAPQSSASHETRRRRGRRSRSISPTPPNKSSPRPSASPRGWTSTPRAGRRS